MTELEEIIRKRNARLTQKPTKRKSKAASFTTLNSHGSAPRYLVDAETRAMAIGRS